MGKKITVEITEPNGTTWTDEHTWVEAPDREDCEGEYNDGALIVIYEDGEEIDSFEI